CEFLIQKRSDAHIFDPLDKKGMERSLLKAEREYIPIGQKLYLHPNKVILGGTSEYIGIPLDLAGRVIARSSYERLGVSVSTLANPGYRGALNLTLVNTGNTPVVLYPGLAIAQLTLHKISSKEREPYSGKYSFEVGPI